MNIVLFIIKIILFIILFIGCIILGAVGGLIGGIIYMGWWAIQKFLLFTSSSGGSSEFFDNL